MAEHGIPVLPPHPYIAAAAIFEDDVVVVIGLELPFVKFLVAVIRWERDRVSGASIRPRIL